MIKQAHRIISQCAKLSTTSVACMPRFVNPSTNDHQVTRIDVKKPAAHESSSSNQERKYEKRFGNSLRLAKKSDSESSRFVMKGKSDQYLSQMDDGQDPDSMLEQHDQDLELYARDKNLYRAKVMDDELRKSHRIKLGIIKKKMKKIEGHKHVNANLLTWDAKEQIKYLHLNYPDEWTVERIVESFPIDEESCRKLLKSTWAPKTLDELIKHDEKCIRNWERLSAEQGEPDHEGPAINIYKEYKEQNRLGLLKHAVGIPDIEMERATVMNDEYSIHEAVLAEPGPFSGIVHRDDKVKRLLNKTRDTDDVKETAVDSSHHKVSHASHLLKTRVELTKSLAKLLMPSDQSTESKKSKSKV